MKNLIDNTLLQSISNIYDNKELFIFKNPDIEKELASDLNDVAVFFTVNIKAAAVFSIIICDQLSGEPNSLTSIMKKLGFKPLDFMKTMEELNQWRSKGLLRSTMRRSSRPINEYIFVKEVIDAVIFNDISKLNVEVPDNQNEAFLKIRSYINSILRTVEQEYIVEVLNSYVYEFKQFELIKEIIDNEDINNLEKAILFYAIAYTQYGVEQFDLDFILNYLDDDSISTFNIKQRISNETSKLFTECYLEFEVQGFVDFSNIVPGEKIKKHINYGVNKNEKSIFSPKYCTLIKPDSIKKANLYFNPQTQKSIDEILSLTSDSFSEVMNRFEENGINPGLSMLYYGMPGTGKTELVKQIAKLNNRMLLLVDVSSVKSKWVGESEKNIKRVFNEYRQAVKFYEEIPILFFNECDALISKRNDVQTSVDQMNNTMQNILLQELEDFKGIFIATTNLIQNIDKAFDRRILYKLHLDQPEIDTRFKILKNQFPSYSDSLLSEISNQNNLTGGQIQNLKKKFLVEQILFKKIQSTEINFKNYIESELNFRENKKKSIGFSVHNL
jgi:hypothetical protein